jgi:hypothetical protein
MASRRPVRFVVQIRDRRANFEAYDRSGDRCMAVFDTAHESFILFKM